MSVIISIAIVIALILSGGIYLLERVLSVLCWLLFSRVDGENPPQAGEFDI